MRYFLSLFAKRRYETIIRNGCMYRRTYKAYRLVKEERIDETGGFTKLTDYTNSPAVGDRSRTDLYRPHPTGKPPENFTKRPENL